MWNICLELINLFFKCSSFDICWTFQLEPSLVRSSLFKIPWKTKWIIFETMKNWFSTDQNSAPWLNSSLSKRFLTSALKQPAKTKPNVSFTCLTLWQLFLLLWFFSLVQNLCFAFVFCIIFQLMYFLKYMQWTRQWTPAIKISERHSLAERVSSMWETDKVRGKAKRWWCKMRIQRGRKRQARRTAAYSISTKGRGTEHLVYGSLPEASHKAIWEIYRYPKCTLWCKGMPKKL